MNHTLRFALLGVLSIPFASAADRVGVSVGLTAGVPILDLFHTEDQIRISYTTLTNRYEIGPSLEFRFPHRLGLQVEGLYTHGSYHSLGTSVDVVTNDRVTMDFWQIPVLAKYRVFDKGIAPFIEGGATFRYVSNIDANRTTLVIPFGRPITLPIPNPEELRNRFASGFVAGGGVDFHSRHVHIAPELRYTRWGWENFERGLFHSNLNRVDFLLGVRF